MFLLFIFGLTALLSKNRPRPRFARVDWLVLSLFLLSAMLATLFSEDPGRSARYLWYLLTSLFLLVLVSSLQTKRQVHLTVAALALLGMVHLLTVLLSGTLSGASTAQEIIDRQPLVTLLVPNDALILGLCLPAILLTAGPMKKFGKHSSMLASIIYLALALYASFLLESKVALICLVTAVITLVAARSFQSQNHARARHPLLPGIFVAALMLTIVLAAWALGNQSTTRLGLWSHAVAGRGPAEILIGTGPNTFHYDPATAVTPFDEEPRQIPWTHNLYLEAYAEQGLLGLVAVLSISIIPIRRALAITDLPMRVFLFSCAATFFLLGLLEITLTRRFYLAFLVLVYGLSCAPALRR